MANLDDEPQALELLLPDGRASGVFFCSKCRYVGPSHIAAKTCCAPKTCEDCGAKYDRKWAHTTCRPCTSLRWSKRLQKAWDEAPKHNGWEWDGPIVTDDQEGYRDGFWNDIDELVCWLEDGDMTIDDVRVYGTKPTQLRLDAADIVIRELEAQDHYEDAIDDISSKGMEQLQNFLTAWCRVHTPTTYLEDKSKALVFAEREDNYGRRTSEDD